MNFFGLFYIGFLNVPRDDHPLSKAREYDKWSHIAGAGFLTLIASAFLSPWLAFGAVMVGGIVLEVVQGIAMRDKYAGEILLSSLDLIANTVGGLIAVWILS